jgi:hypothetical protein
MRYIFDIGKLDSILWKIEHLKEASLDLENKLAVRSSATGLEIIASRPTIANRHDFVAGVVLPASKPEAMLVSYVSCPVTDCSAIVIPAIENLAQARRFDLLTRTWSLRCPRCSMQFSVAESELKQANVPVDRIRQDYPHLPSLREVLD